MVIIAAKKAPKKPTKGKGKVDPRVIRAPEGLDKILTRLSRALETTTGDLRTELNHLEDALEDDELQEKDADWDHFGNYAVDSFFGSFRDAVDDLVDSIADLFKATREDDTALLDALRDLLQGIPKKVTLDKSGQSIKTIEKAIKLGQEASKQIPNGLDGAAELAKLRGCFDKMAEASKLLTGKPFKVPDLPGALPWENPDQLKLFASVRVARVVARFAAQGALKSH